MKSIFKLLKGSGWLNLLGMSVAFAAIYIILVQVNFDLGFNRSFKDADRIYVLAASEWFEPGKYQTYTNRPLSKAMFDASPEVESYGATKNVQKEKLLLQKKDKQLAFEVGFLPATLSALQLFGYEAVAGTFEGMDKQETVAISESLAKRTGLQIGDAVDFEDDDLPHATVSAIFKDQSANSILGDGELVYCMAIETEDIDVSSAWNFHHYVKLKSAEGREAFEQTANVIVEKGIKEEAKEEGYTPEQLAVELEMSKTKLFALPEMYYSDLLTDSLYKGNLTTTITLLVVAILILLITLVNYVNFFMAQIPLQLRSVNTRKILGSSRFDLVLRFMGEAGLLVVLALLLAELPVLFFKQSEYASFISCPLDLSTNQLVVFITFTVAILMTLVASIYPALTVTSFSPALALKGTMGSTQRGKIFRYLLVGFQFVISFVFFICTGLLKNQYHTMMDYDMGFNKEQLYSVDLPIQKKHKEAIAAELRKRPEVKNFAWSMSPIVGRPGMTWGRNYNGVEILYDVHPVSYNFLHFIGIEIAEGRDFSAADEHAKAGVFIFNETAKQQFGLSLEDRIPAQGEEAEIAGFCKDFHYQSLQFATKPLAFYVADTEWKLNHLYVRSAASSKYPDVVKAIQETVKKVSPDVNVAELKVNFFDEELGKLYQKEQKLIQLVTLFSILTIVIALMGIVGLLMFETNYRRKEIGVRRVHGATVAEILLLFNQRYLKILVVSFVIAAPISYVLISYYYSNFAYRPPIHWWVFALAFLAVLFITVFTVTLCCYKAAATNPAESITNE